MITYDDVLKNRIVKLTVDGPRWVHHNSHGVRVPGSHREYQKGQLFRLSERMNNPREGVFYATPLQYVDRFIDLSSTHYEYFVPLS